jgi:hypothetical protein
MDLPEDFAPQIESLALSHNLRDLWIVRTADIPECYAEAPYLVIATVAEDAEPWKIEEAIRASVDPRLTVHVFPEYAVYQTPRPLLLRMAFTHGVNVRTV